MLNRQALLQSINQPEERLLLAKVLDQADFSLKKHENNFSDFCNPASMEKINQIATGITGLNYMVFGGSEMCERRRVGFCPDYRELSQEDFPIDVVKVSYNAKFSKELTHRDFLGSVLGLGIDRGKVGDIFIYETHTLIFAAREISSYIGSNLTNVGRTSVTAQVQTIEEADMPKNTGVEKFVTVSSLRVDAVIGACFNLSRGKAQALIEGEKVLVNWVTAKNGGKTLKEGDMISARGFGRGKLIEVKGETKKGRIAITLLKYV
ncbi:MAG: RNA-binding protein [Anaerotignaceae bacterium]